MANYLNNFRYRKPAALSKLAATKLAFGLFHTPTEEERYQSDVAELQKQQQALQALEAKVNAGRASLEEKAALKEKQALFNRYVRSLRGNVPDHEKRLQKADEAYVNLIHQNNKQKADLQKQISEQEGTISYLKGEMNQRANSAREKLKKTKAELEQLKTRHSRLSNEFDAAQARESAVRKGRNAWRSGAYTLGGAGAGYGLTSLLTRNPWLRGAGAGIGGIGGYLAANPKLVTDFINRFKNNNNKMASVSGKAMKKVASPFGLTRQWLLDRKARQMAQEFREDHYDDVVKHTTGLGGVTGAGIGGGLAYLIARKVTENRLARAGITGAGALIGGATGAGIGYKAAPAVEAGIEQRFIDAVKKAK